MLKLLCIDLYVGLKLSITDLLDLWDNPILEGTKIHLFSTTERENETSTNAALTVSQYFNTS